MFIVISIVFVGVFVVAALLMVSVGLGASNETKKTLATLDSALASTALFGNQAEDETIDIRRHELLSSLPWLNRWLVELDVAPRLRLLLYQANLKWTVGTLLLMCLSAGVILGYAIYSRTEGLQLALVLFVAGNTLPLFYVFWQRSRRFSLFEQNLPGALDMIVGALRAGHSLISAISLVAREAPAPINKEFRICFDEQNFGVELRTAMMNLTKRVPIPDVRIVVTAILIQKESGGNLAEVLEKVAAIIRDRFRLKKQIMVHTAQGRLTGIILSLLPPVLAFVLYLVNPEHMSVLWKREIGIQLIYTSITMTLIGGLIIRKIVNIRV